MIKLSIELCDIFHENFFYISIYIMINSFHNDDEVDFDWFCDNTIILEIIISNNIGDNIQI